MTTSRSVSPAPEMNALLPVNSYRSPTRTARVRNEAASEISRTWGGPQIVGGPVLVIPYRSSYTDNAGRLVAVLGMDLVRQYL